jgi:hypothetical protein
MTTRQIHDSAPETPTLDPRELETALSLGEHREIVLEAMRTNDWRAVDALPEVDLSGQADVRMVA